MSTRKHFDATEDDYIRDHAGTNDWGDIARHLKRSYSGIRKRARFLGCSMRKCVRWTEKEDATVRDGRGRSLSGVARELGRSVSECSARCRVLGITSWPWHKNGGRFKTNRAGYTIVGFKRANGKPTKAVLEHIVIAEEMLGRSIRRGEIVHHINTVKTDNRRENLAVVQGCGAHRRVHTSVERLIPELLDRGIIFFNNAEGVYQLCKTDR